MSINERVSILSKILGEKNSLFYTFWQCMNFTKGEGEDFVKYASKAIRELKQFKLVELSSDISRHV